MKKILKWLLLGWLVVTLAALVFYWPLIHRFIKFNPRVARASYPSATTVKEAQTQDLDYLAAVLDYDRSFSKDDRATFLREIESLKASPDELSKAAFYLKTHELMALADNAHTSSDFVTAFRQFNRSGIDFYAFEDGLFVVRAHKSLANLIGKRLVSIDGREPELLLTGLAKYSGGPRARRDLQSLYYLRSPALLHAAGFAEQPDSISVRLQSEDDSIEEYELPALPDAAETDFSYRHPFLTLSPYSLSDEGGEWVRALDGEVSSPPLTLSEPHRVTLSKKMDGGVYVRSNYLMGSRENRVKKQLLESLSRPPTGGFKFIVFDLRWNPGGNFSNAIPFAQRASEALSKDGTAYVIVGPQTFSAAIVSAALFKKYLPDRTIIIGEPMGDRPQFWAERGTSFVLPNSEFHMAYATGFHDWEKQRDDSVEFLFPPNRKEAADIGSLKVDVLLRPTFKEYAAGEDPVLNWALQREHGAPDRI